MILIILGRATQFFLALLMMRVATTLLSPLEMGRIALVTTTTAFFAMFLINPVGMFINRRLHAWRDNGTARHYLFRYLVYLLSVAVCAMIFLSFMSEIGWLQIGIPIEWLVFLICGSLVFTTINQTAIPSLNLLGDSKHFVLLSIATISASFSLASLFVYLTQPQAQFWLLGLLAGQMLLGIAGTSILFKKLKIHEVLGKIPKLSKGHLLRLFNFSWPVSFAAAFSWLQAQGYRYFFDGENGLAYLGMFVAGYGISMGMIAGFESILTTYFQPRLYSEVHNGDVRQQTVAWQRYALSVLPSLVVTIGLIISLAPELTKILLGTRFQSAAEFVVWGALAEAARVFAGVYSLIAHVFMKTRWLVLPNFLGAAVAMAASMVLIPLFGGRGAGMGLVISGWLVVISLHLLLAKRVVGGVPIKAIAKALGAAVALLALAFLMRSILASGKWSTVVVVTGLVGLAYVMIQYYFLRQHFGKKEQA